MMLPGEYYLKSRYSSSMTIFIIYLAKYWGSIIIFYELYIEHSSINTFSFYCLSLLLYFSIYDYFCCVNDNEPEAVTQRSGEAVSFVWALSYAVLFSCLGIFFNGFCFSSTIGVCLLITIIFGLHNALPEKFRVITYFLLYFLKPFVFFHGMHGFLPIVIFSSLYSFSYIPFYFVKKFHLQWPNIVLKIICSGIFLKSIFLLFFIPFYTKFAYLLVWQILFTVLDFISGKQVSKVTRVGKSHQHPRF